MHETALRYFRQSLNRDDVSFRDAQWECIQALLARKRIFVVRRTGCGTRREVR
jgi:superfamily II DNA helicase RecQ